MLPGLSDVHQAAVGPFLQDMCEVSARADIKLNASFHTCVSVEFS